MPSAPAKSPPVDIASADERAAAGKAARKKAPRSSHGEWAPAARRRDPVKVLEDQAKNRVPELVPIRYGRMLASPFTFYRGAAAIMAMDLAKTPESGFRVQAMRRRPPLELRDLRRPRSQPGVGRQRLRRDPSRALGMGRQASRSQLRDRRAGPQLHPEGDPPRRPPNGPLLPRGDARVRRDAEPRRLVRAPRRRHPARRPGQGRRPQADEGGAEERGEGREEEQHQGVRSPRPRGRWRAADHQRSAAAGPCRGARLRGPAPRARGADPRDARPLPREPRGRPPPPPRQLPVRRDGPQGGRGRQRRDAAPGWC